MTNISQEAPNPPELDLSGLPTGTTLREYTTWHPDGNLLTLKFDFPPQGEEALPYEFSTGVTHVFSNKDIGLYMAYLSRTRDHTSVKVFGINPGQKQDIIDAVKQDIVPDLFSENY